MAKAQYPIDGKPGKAWKVTSIMGWRIHPVTKTKKHHNGTDIWSGQEPCWIEAPYDGTVLYIGNNPAGFGNSVTLLHKIKGDWYTTLYAHMADGSVKVKKGQKIEAGTPLGKMGSTGMSTGKHLHWELHKGKVHTWNATGAGYIEPVKFFDHLIEWEKSIATAPVETPPDAPVAPAPTHDDQGAAELVKTEAAVAVAAAVAAPATPISRPAVKVGSKGVHVKHLQEKLGITADGVFGPDTKKHVMEFQAKHDLKVDGTVGPKTWKAIG